LIRQLIPSRYTQPLPSINIGNDMNRNVLKASGGASITQNESRLLMIMVGAILFLGLSIAIVAVVVYGGRVQVRDGDREIKVEQPHGRHYPDDPPAPVDL